MKIAVIGCGLRTPLLIHGLAHSDLGATELALYDIDSRRAETMAAMGGAIASNTNLRAHAAARLQDAIEGCSFVVSSIRVGGMEARARDEQIAVDHGFAGQETTGPAGMAMALRTVPVAIDQARLVEKYAPDAWLISFTNPAGLITQAITTHTNVRAVGICDTPAELFHQIALATGFTQESLEFDYFGLNHLGWIRRIRAGKEDITGRLMRDDALLRKLYPADLFSPSLIRALGVIPTEYLFFYYNAETALRHQQATGTTRGRELLEMNARLLRELDRLVGAKDLHQALYVYRTYLNRRNSSYFQLEAAGGSAFRMDDSDWNPFHATTGYHRIAVEVMRGLAGIAPVNLILNVPNRGSIAGLAADDVVEIPSLVTKLGPQPVTVGPPPHTVSGLMAAVKSYERQTIDAALKRSARLAALALMLNPIVGQWGPARRFVDALVHSDPEHFGGYLEASP